MYKEYRATSPSVGTASTPEMWAANFEASQKVGLYRRLAFRLDHRWKIIQRYVPRGRRILDAGCGAGEWVAFLNDHGRDAEGLDYSPELVARVRQMYPRYRWQSGEIQALPYGDATFDAVISWGVIEHDEAGPDRALAEFWRVLSDNGLVIVTVPVDSDRQRRASRAHFPQANDGSRAFFQYFMSVEELSAYVTRAGFDIVKRGLQRVPAATLLAPELSARMSPLQRNMLNWFARVALWWRPEIRNMAYCVGRKRVTRA
jgi:ubiquinone/menaquinone biosynthesis C-methylase UbiE